MSLGWGLISGRMISIALIAAFPELVSQALDYGVTSRAREADLWRFKGVSLRDFATDMRRTIDARPAAGGAGMVLLPAPLNAALSSANAWHGCGDSHVIMMSPDGAPLTQNTLQCLRQMPNLTLVAGRYEGVDQRWIDQNVDQIISMGDYVLSGGELAAAVLIDGLVRLIPGALGDSQSNVDESFSTPRLDWPHYASVEMTDVPIPAALRRGSHADAMAWRLKEAFRRTWCRRPDLLVRANLTVSELALIEENTLKYKANLDV